MIIKEAELFKGVALETLDMISSFCHERLFKGSEVIFREGEAATSFFILEEGQVDVWVPGRGGTGIHFVVNAPGEVFGFMALAEPPVHVATATAITEVKAVDVPVEVVQKVLEAPTRDSLVLLKNLVRLLAQRLRRAYGLVAEEVARETAPAIQSYG